jgi:hypothetical protein
MPERDELDLLLDAGLATYADPGLDSGLEERVLSALAAARMTTQERSRSAWWPKRLAWAVAVPLAASLLLWISIAKISHAPSSHIQQAYKPETAKTPNAIAPRIEAGGPAHPSEAKARVHPATSMRLIGSTQDKMKSCPLRTSEAAKCAPLPKLDVFPKPTPPSMEEQALVIVANTGPASRREALIESQQHADAPLSIVALNIPPLAAPGEGKN